MTAAAEEFVIDYSVLQIGSRVDCCAGAATGLLAEQQGCRAAMLQRVCSTVCVAAGLRGAL